MPELKIAPKPADRRPAENLSLGKSHCVSWLLAALCFSLAYAVLRYNVFGDVAWANLPLYIVNKATSLAAVILIASSYLIGKWIHPFADDPFRRQVLVKFLGLAGFALAALHSVLSLMLLTPDYYPKFFGDGRMSLTGECAMVFGALGLFWMTSPFLTSLPNMKEELGSRLWKRSQRFGYLALSFVAAHLFAMGIAGWLTPGEWFGGMPPISMLGFVVVLVPIAARWATRS